MRLVFQSGVALDQRTYRTMTTNVTTLRLILAAFALGAA
jgi:hypothetical protein